MLSPITKSKLIIGEGLDEENFFKALLTYMRVPDFEVRNVGGNGRFNDTLPVLFITSGFSRVQSLAIIRDAEQDANAAFESIANIVRREGLTPPPRMNEFSHGTPRIGVFIIPDNSSRGMLEDLCLRTVETHPSMTCVNEFTNCIFNLQVKPENQAKAKALAFIASMPKHVTSVGVAALKGYWDFSSAELTQLKTFLTQI